MKWVIKVRNLTLEDRRKIELTRRRNDSPVKIAAALEISQRTAYVVTLIFSAMSAGRALVWYNAAICFRSETCKRESDVVQ